MGAEWGKCVKITPYTVAGERQRANSRALLIAECLVGLPYISHMVTHMQHGAGVARGLSLYLTGTHKGAETLRDLLPLRSELQLTPTSQRGQQSLKKKKFFERLEAACIW